MESSAHRLLVGVGACQLFILLSITHRSLKAKLNLLFTSIIVSSLECTRKIPAIIRPSLYRLVVPFEPGSWDLQSNRLSDHLIDLFFYEL